LKDLPTTRPSPTNRAWKLSRWHGLRSSRTLKTSLGSEPVRLAGAIRVVRIEAHAAGIGGLLSFGVEVAGIKKIL